jgi:hypothetical protein
MKKIIFVILVINSLLFLYFGILTKYVLFPKQHHIDSSSIKEKFDFDRSFYLPRQIPASSHVTNEPTFFVEQKEYELGNVIEGEIAKGTAK